MIVTSSSTRLLDTANLVFVIHDPYNIAVTNFGDYESNAFKQLTW